MFLLVTIIFSIVIGAMLLMLVSYCLAHKECNRHDIVFGLQLIGLWLAIATFTFMGRSVHNEPTITYETKKIVRIDGEAYENSGGKFFPLTEFNEQEIGDKKWFYVKKTTYNPLFYIEEPKQYVLIKE